MNVKDASDLSEPLVWSEIANKVGEAPSTGSETPMLIDADGLSDAYALPLSLETHRDRFFRITVDVR